MRSYIAALLLVVGCAAQADSPEQREMAAYREYLVAEVNAGRMTQEQARYLMIQKQNQMSERGDAAMRQGIEMMNSSGPYQPNRSVQCTTQFGVTTCR